MAELIAVEAAVGLVADGATVVFGGSGAGHAVPQKFIDVLEARFLREGRPRGITTVRTVGMGDFGDVGMSQLAHAGLMARTIGSNIGNEPRLGDLVAAGMLEAYSFPQGVLSQLMREIAARRPGLVTRIGLDTYVDPRATGGKQNSRTAADLVERVELAGEEWLLYRAFPIDVAVIRGTTADESGSISMEKEAIRGEMLDMAMAARNSGGIVIAQVQRVAAQGTLPPRSVSVPGALVDYVYVDPDQRQTYATEYSPYYAGELQRPRVPVAAASPPDVRRLIARRALLEIGRGYICNLGFGISQLIGELAAEEGLADQITLTVEQGVFGGIPAGGPDGGAGCNWQAVVEQPAMFAFYDGGGLDLASVSFAEVDAAGSVNVHAFGSRLRGPGGFINITAVTRRVLFVGTLTAGGLEVAVDEDGLRILREGAAQKFVGRVREVSFSGPRALAQGQRVSYITERAVFDLEPGGLVLVEVAPGIDPEADVIRHMEFRPRVAEPLRVMDRRLFRAEPMGLGVTLPPAERRRERQERRAAR